MSGQSYTTELRSTIKQLKVENSKVNALRKRRRTLEASLTQYMERYQLDSLDGFDYNKINSITKPKPPPIPKKSEQEKRNDGIEYYRQLGIVNPEQCYKEFIQTQRI